MKDRNGKDLNTQNILEKIIIRIKTIILEFWLMILRFVGFIPIHFVRKFFYVLSGVEIPLDSTIHIGANFFNPSNIIIGHDTIIGDHCFLDGRAPLKIGNHVGIASQVLIYNNEHDINSVDYGNSFGLLHERCQLCQIAVWASSNAISGSYNHTAFMEK